MYRYDTYDDAVVYANVIRECLMKPTPNSLDLADKYAKLIFKMVGKVKPDADGVKRKQYGRLDVTISPCGVMKLSSTSTNKYDYLYVSDENRHILTEDEIKDMTYTPNVIKPDFTDIAEKTAKRNQRRKPSVVKPTPVRFIKAFEVCLSGMTESDYVYLRHKHFHKYSNLSLILLMITAYYLKMDINKHFKYCITGSKTFTSQKKYGPVADFEIIESLQYLEIQEETPSLIDRNPSVLERRALSLTSYWDAALKLFVQSFGDSISNMNEGLTMRIPKPDSINRFLAALDDADVKTSIDWSNPYTICSAISTIAADAKMDYEEIPVSKYIRRACRRDYVYSYYGLDTCARYVEPEHVSILKTDLMKLYRIFDSYRVNNPVMYSILRDIELVKLGYVPTFKYETLCKPDIQDMRPEEWQNARGSSNIVRTIKRLINDRLAILRRRGLIESSDYEAIRKPVIDDLLESYTSLPDGIDACAWETDESEVYEAARFDIMDFDELNAAWRKGLQLKCLRNMDYDYNINRQHNDVDIIKTMQSQVVEYIFADKINELVDMSYKSVMNIET